MAKQVIPTALEIAFNHVREKHPTVSIVIFDRNASWCYMDENFNAFKFDESIDTGILEAASDSIANSSHPLPFIYQETER